MALLYFDGFETYPASILSLSFAPGLGNNKLYSITKGNELSSNHITNNGRYSNQCFSLSTDYNVTRYLNFNLSGTYPTMIIGLALRQRTVGSASYSGNSTTFGLIDGTTYQLRFCVVGSELHVYNGNGTKLGETTGANIIFNAWRYIEVKATIHSTIGSVVIRSGEIEVLSLSNINTQKSGNAYATGLMLGSINNYLWCDIDDIYICDTSGSKCNDFLGDCRVDSIRPNGNGTYTDFTPSAGTNYQNVDDAPYHDGVSTYNTSSNVGDKDSYIFGTLPNPPTGATIHGIKPVAVIYKTDVGEKSAKILTISGATEHATAEVPLSDSPVYYQGLLEDNPDDSASFEDADINAIEIGVEASS